MNRIILFTIILFNSFHVNSQGFLPKISQIKVGYYIDYEKKIGSAQLKRKLEYLNFDQKVKLDQPIIFKRKYSDSLIMLYFFSIPDSIVREITLELNSGDTIKLIDSQKIKLTIERINLTYSHIKDELQYQFGNPVKSENLNKYVLPGLKSSFNNFNSEFYERKDYWDDDKVKIYFYYDYFNEKNTNQYKIRAEIYFN